MTLDNPALIWVALAIVAAIVEVSIPHFGFVFVSVGAIAAAIAACRRLRRRRADRRVRRRAGRCRSALLRPRLVGRLGGRGVPSRTEPLIGHEGVVTHDIDPTLGAGRVNVGGEDWAARARGADPRRHARSASSAPTASFWRSHRA